MKVTTTSLALRRLGFLIASAVLTALLTWVTGEYATAAWYPVIYFLLTTAKDFFNKELPNK